MQRLSQRQGINVVRLFEDEDFSVTRVRDRRQFPAVLAQITLPQLLRVIDYAWKEGFDETVRDKGLIQEACLLVHLRNTICHMSAISAEETDRIKQTMRDWFRIVAP